MKIAILSLIPCENYGGIMQSYALQTVLSRMGHEVCIISKSRKQKILGLKKLYIYPSRLIKKYIFHQNLIIKQNDKEIRLLNRNEDIRCSDIYPFLNVFLNIRYIRFFSDIKPKEYDAIVVGSDQVWRQCYFEQQYREPIQNAFLSFADNWRLRRFAYGASFGTDIWEYNEETTQCCSRLINLFDGVSVREESGVEFCNNIFNVNASRVIDPTLLLDKRDYLGLIPGGDSNSEGGLLVYLLDESTAAMSLVDRIVREEHMTPFSTNVAWTDKQGVAIKKPSVQTWLKGFSDAEFVITDSYHACIFSIIFNKPFVVFGNKERGMARFTTLLSDFNLDNHLIFHAEDYCSGSYFLNKAEIESKLCCLKRTALEYISTICDE